MNIQDIFTGKVEQEVLDDVLGFFSGIITAVEKSPEVQTAVKELQQDVMNGVTATVQWAGTVADDALGGLSKGVQAAVLGEVGKFMLSAGISAQGPLGVAEMMLIQGAMQVAEAAAKAAVAAAIPKGAAT